MNQIDGNAIVDDKIAVRRPHGRVRGMASWSPRGPTRDLLDAVQGVLDEYRDHLPLTVRQIFYRLVATIDYPKTEDGYARLGEHLNRARRAGMIPFESIRDDGSTLAEPSCWRDAAGMVVTFRYTAEQFRMDRQIGQPATLFFAVEAAGMVPQIQRVADPFGISVQSGGGFDSVSAKHALATRLGQCVEAEVLHIGDHDPSGVHLFTSMAEDVLAISTDLGFGTDITFTRLAVTPEQIAAMHLVTSPPKPTDRRSFVGQTAQCEAIPPDVLAGIVHAAIESRLDRAAYDRVLAEEDAAKVELRERLRAI